ncbi:MAG TPA: preprotein translocase subunit SecE [Candidatus Saccharibacteria bacterium]|jgi:preprotein translocase SecE subunit|nr:preprotein translocase subunit SecE [Candidatus Saccharibacteria bacterium]
MTKKPESKNQPGSDLAPEGEAKGILNWYRNDVKRKLNMKIPKIPMPGFLKLKIPIPKPVKMLGNYVRKSFAELKEVTWPSRRLSTNYTFSVITFTLFFSLLLTGVDWVFTELVKKMLL